MASADDCTQIWDSWRPRLLLNGTAKVHWRDTIDAASSRLVPRLKSCWNPHRLEMDGMSLEIPSRWAKKVGSKCMPGSHWFEFARIFGEVIQVDFVVSSSIAYLVVRFEASGAYEAYKKLSGRCLYFESKDLCVIRAVYGQYSSLLSKALKEQSLEWQCQAVAPPKPTGRLKGPIFELYPLRGERSPSREVLRIVPWGPSRLSLGKHRTSHFCVTDELQVVSNSHAELCVMKNRETGIRLYISDSSRNGTWINDERLAKGVMKELRDGDVVRVAEKPRFLVRSFNSLEGCQRALPPVDAPIFKVPPCPYFIKKVKTTNPWAEVPRVPGDDDELWAEVPRLPDEEEEIEPLEPTKKRLRWWKTTRPTAGYGLKAIVTSWLVKNGMEHTKTSMDKHGGWVKRLNVIAKKRYPKARWHDKQDPGAFERTCF